MQKQNEKVLTNYSQTTIFIYIFNGFDGSQLTVFKKISKNITYFSPFAQKYIIINYKYIKLNTMKNTIYNVKINIKLNELNTTEFEYFMITLKSLKNIYGDAIEFSNADIKQITDYETEGTGIANLNDIIDLIK